jgi:hypothetical protein
MGFVLTATESATKSAKFRHKLYHQHLDLRQLASRGRREASIYAPHLVVIKF